MKAINSASTKSENSNAYTTDSSAPLLKNRLKVSFFVIILPLFLLLSTFFFFYQKSSQALNTAIDGVIIDVIPAMELKDKVQQSIISFNKFLNNHKAEHKTKFFQLSNSVKKALANPIVFEQKKHSLSKDIYRSAYLNWRNAHRIAQKIINTTAHKKEQIPHTLLQEYYQYVIATTLNLDKLHLAMQDKVKIRFHKAQTLESDATILISVVFLFIYIITLSTVYYLNRSILKPIKQLEQWALGFSRGKANKVILPSNSYQEFEFIAATYTKLAKMLQDDQAVLEQLSQKDELTQVNNRRSFLNHLKTEHIRHQRYNNQYSMIYIDVDHMGAVNQNYGEHIGDLTLIHISKKLEDAIRPTDILSRYDSDEFIIILPEEDKNGAYTSAERIRNSISEHVFKINNFKFGVTVSIAYSQIQDNQSLAMNLQCIDYALQKAKSDGKNQVQHCQTEQLRTQNSALKYFKPADIGLLN